MSQYKQTVQLAKVTIVGHFSAKTDWPTMIQTKHPRCLLLYIDIFNSTSLSPFLNFFLPRPRPVAEIKSPLQYIRLCCRLRYHVSLQMSQSKHSSYPVTYQGINKIV